MFYLYYKSLKVSNQVEPLSFHGMSNIPDDETVEHYPDDADHQQYWMEYNTRGILP